MVTAFRSDNEVTNGTAGTSVTVSKPAGIVDTGNNEDRDHLIAFIAATGAPTFTPPGGWNLITTAVDAGNTVTLKAYRKLASSEGASWTWTLGTSQRNWGWVGAYTGVDPDDPVAESGVDLTMFTSTIASLDVPIHLPPNSVGVGAVAAVRAASGSATTWTASGTAERADLSTNAGAGTDITGVVDESTNSGFEVAFDGITALASQTQTAGVVIVVTLNPYFVPYGGGVGDEGLILEAALGVNPDSDSSEWSWTNLTTLGLHQGRIVLEHGRANRTSVADPSRMAFALLNLNGEFTSPTGAYTQYMVRNLPFRVRLNGFGADVGGTGYHRGTAFLASMRPRWDPSANFAVVDIVAQGRLRRLQRRTDVLHSAGYRSIIGVGRGIFFLGAERFIPVGYWPFEDESDATVAASAIPGIADLTVSGVTFAADSTSTGSAALATLATGASITAHAPGSGTTGFWSGIWVMSVPAIPAATTTVMTLKTTGTAPTWRIDLVPGGTDQWAVRAFDSAGSSLLNQAVGVVAAEPYVFSLSARQNGSDIDYQFWYLRGASEGGFGVSGTVSGRTTGRLTQMTPNITADLNGAVFGHLAIYDDPDYVESTDPATAASAIFDAKPAQNELPSNRFGRLCDEEGIPNLPDSPDYNDIFMGPQPVGTLMALLRESETVDDTVLNDSGVSGSQTGMLWLPARDARENVDATMTLDIDSGHVVPLFEPELDDQDVVNDVEVSRVGGSTARVTDETSITVEGRFRELVTVNTSDDTFLAHLAGLRVNLGTVKGMRFPAVGWNMRRTPTLAQQWTTCRLFHRVDIANPPSQYPPDDIQTVLEGYAEVLAQDEWTVRGYLSPYQPNKVFELAETSADQNQWAGRLAGDDARVRVAIDSDDTSIVVDPNAFRWTLVADDFDPDPTVRFGGETATVSAISTTAATFVAAGTAASAHSANVTPGLPAGATTGDLLLIFAAIRATTGGVNTPTDYTRLPIFNATDNAQVFAKVHDGSESDPTVSFTGGGVGNDTQAQMAAFRNTPITLPDLADIVLRSDTQLNASAQNIAVPSLVATTYPGQIVLAFGVKQDDWTSVTSPTGFTEIGEPVSTVGNDQGITWGYRIDTTPLIVGVNASFTVTGGTSQVSRSAVASIAGGYQSMTAARSVNGVVKSHAVGTSIAVENPGVLGL